MEFIELGNKSKDFCSSLILWGGCESLGSGSEESDSFIDFVFPLLESSLGGSACFLGFLYLLVFVVH